MPSVDTEQCSSEGNTQQQKPSPSSGRKPATPTKLGDLFAPLLREACDNRLGTIGWFRADWQRGGAKTGRAKYTLRPDQFQHPVKRTRPDNGTVQVVVKIPIRPSEYIWNKRMQPDEEDPNGITAQIFESSTELSQYDFIWVVMERFAAGPLFGIKRKDAVALVSESAARFYRRANRFKVDKELRHEDWPVLIERARQSCRNEALPNPQVWHKAIKSLQKIGPILFEEWESRPLTGWIHGDLHPANVMSRSDDDPKDPAMLIDFAEVRPGHWIEDAVYFERLFWARRSVIESNPPARLFDKARKKLGIPGAGDASVEGDVTRLANIRRVLLAATAPAYLRSEGNPTYLASCLDVLEKTLPKVK